MFNLIKKKTSEEKKEPLGNGKAVFFGLGSEEDFVEQERKDKGLKGWYDKLKNL